MCSSVIGHVRSLDVYDNVIRVLSSIVCGYVRGGTYNLDDEYLSYSILRGSVNKI